MTPEAIRKALADSAALRVQTRSGKIYDVERDVILAMDSTDPAPLIYGWPVVPRWHPSHGRVRWFLVSNLKVHKPVEKRTNT
jgi:hypothetical protein